MDMETVLPRTCTECHGAGTILQINDIDYTTEACECQYKEETNA